MHPVIISASRSTDIPAFYSDWFIKHLDEGIVQWKNPFNNKIYDVYFDKTRVIVFWTKNPAPIIKHLKYISNKNLNYYFQFTLNDYELERFEPGLPSLNERIETFQMLSSLIGKEKVIWRFDPLILSAKTDINALIEKISRVGDRLISFTDKLVISFVDIMKYKKVLKNLISKSDYFNIQNIKDSEFTDKQKIEFAEKINKSYLSWQKINSKFSIATCAEEIALEEYGIKHNKCIDDELLIRLFEQDESLMEFLGYKNKDKGQRKHCRCIVSKDIGMYNTCRHNCVYCYANDYSIVNKIEINI